MTTDRDKNGAGFLFGILAAFFWSVHFPLLIAARDTHPVVFYFHALFWASITSVTLVTITGRLDALSHIGRRRGALAALVLTGGFSLWMMMATALRRAQGVPSIAWVFYTGPVMLVILSMFTKKGAGSGRLGMTLVGCMGGLLILRSSYGLEIPGVQALLPALGAALCWAAFSLVCAGLLRRVDTLPVLAITLSLSTLCVFFVCLAMGLDVLSINRGDIGPTILAGGVSMALGCGLWMKCMSVQESPSNAAAWWYGALIFSGVWYHFFVDEAIRWPAFVGAAFIVLAFQSQGSGRERTEKTFGDMLSRKK